MPQLIARIASALLAPPRSPSSANSARSSATPASTARRSSGRGGAYMVRGGGIGGFGGVWLEHLRQWLGMQWPGLSPWVSWALPSGHFDPAAARRRRTRRLRRAAPARRAAGQRPSLRLRSTPAPSSPAHMVHMRCRCRRAQYHAHTMRMQRTYLHRQVQQLHSKY